jgi:hypothetical protein
MRLEHAPKIILTSSVEELVVRYEGDGFVHNSGSEGILTLMEYIAIPEQVFERIGLEKGKVGVRERRDWFYDICIMRQCRGGEIY